MTKVVLLLIRLYQLFISPLFASLGCGCRFYPTCSDYARSAYMKMGFLKATALTVWRILKCNHLHPGGVDYMR